MNTGAFTGRAEAYTKARPGYSDEAVEYIHKLAPPNAVFADIGAGTGKFTELLAKYGNEIFAVEPDTDMLEQLKITLTPFPNTKVIDGSAEETKISDNSVDLIISAQALPRFDIEAFRAECQRIGKPCPIVVTLYNCDAGEEVEEINSSSRYGKVLGALYQNRTPIIRDFPHSTFFTRDKWLLYFMSMDGVPLDESNPEYGKWTAEKNKEFDRDSVDGVLRLNLVTRVYSERIE